MPVGLEIINNSGSLLITADAMTPGLVTKKTLSFTYPSPQAQFYWGSVVFNNCVNPIFAYRPLSDVRVAMLQVGKPDANGNVTVRYYYFHPTAPTSGTVALIEIYHFDDVSPNTGPNQGLRLYSPAGLCVFNSNNLPMLVAGEVAGTAGGTFTPPAGRTYAFVPNGRNVKAYTMGTSAAPYYMDLEGNVCRFNGTQLVVEWHNGSTRYTNQSIPPTPSGIGGFVNVLLKGGVVIDVTGM